MAMSLVLLPGLDGTGLMFRPFLRALPSAIEPIVVAYPGDRPLTYQQLMPLVLDHLPRTGNFIILGESFSGPLAVMVAASRPTGLVGLVLCASFVTKPWRFVGPAAVVLARTLPFRLYLPFKRLRGLMFGSLTIERDALIDQIARIVRPDVIAFRVRMVFRTDVRETFRTCHLPMLYLNGTRDRLVPHRNLRIVQQIRPEIRVAEFNSSHMILQCHPSESANVISVFISSIQLPTEVR